jgi:hypothetical protein
MKNKIDLLEKMVGLLVDKVETLEDMNRQLNKLLELERYNVVMLEEERLADKRGMAIDAAEYQTQDR